MILFHFRAGRWRFQGAGSDSAAATRLLDFLAVCSGVSAPGARAGPGELALVLHTHMPYVEGFGTWPFGEEWLWEAIATRTCRCSTYSPRGAASRCR